MTNFPLQDETFDYFLNSKTHVSTTVNTCQIFTLNEEVISELEENGCICVYVL